METNRERLTVDVCVIGGAGGGLSAGLRAKETGGEKVLIIDKNKVMGGCTRLCGGFFAVESHVQKRQGIHHTADELFREHMRMTSWHCNAKLVRKWYHGSAKIVRWLEDRGLKCTKVQGWGPGNIKTSHWMEGNGNQLVNILLEACEKAGVDLMTETRGTKLLTDNNGAVIGVLAKKDDQELEIRAKSVIIVTGSIGYNKDLLARFYPGKDFSNVKIMTGVEHNTGDGLLMAEEIGAANGHMSTHYIGPHNHPGNMRIGNIMRRPMMIFLNRNGERFVDESIPQYESWSWMRAMAIELQPDRMCFPMMDESIFREMLRRRENMSYIEAYQGTSKRQDMLAKYGTNAPAIESGMDDPCAWLDMLEDDFRKEVAKGEDSRMAICNTLDEVADYIGANPEVLKVTIKEYNSFCEMEYDNEFLKQAEYLWPLTTPPYYVFKGFQGIDTCIGGILIDHNMRVLDKKHYPIKNLYAAGVCTSGWANNGYSFTSTCLGSTLWGGYSAGELAAKMAMKQ